jgi:hypothetical protein
MTTDWHKPWHGDTDHTGTECEITPGAPDFVTQYDHACGICRRHLRSATPKAGPKGGPKTSTPTGERS